MSKRKALDPKIYEKDPELQYDAAQLAWGILERRKQRGGDNRNEPMPGGAGGHGGGNFNTGVLSSNETAVLKSMGVDVATYQKARQA
jgi:hypothetical protein